jgi:hypothetical protein
MPSMMWKRRAARRYPDGPSSSDIRFLFLLALGEHNILHMELEEGGGNIAIELVEKLMMIKRVMNWGNNCRQSLLRSMS